MKFRADSESYFRIRLSFELTILGFCKTHVHPGKFLRVKFTRKIAVFTRIITRYYALADGYLLLRDRKFSKKILFEL
jgi:hypothetical protein